MSEAVDRFIEFAREKTSGNPLSSSSIFLSGNLTMDLFSNSLPDNHEGSAILGMAYAMAVDHVGSFTLPDNVNSYDDIVVTGFYPRNFETEMDGENVMVRSELSKNGNVPTFTPGRMTENDCGDYGGGNIHLCPDESARALYAKVVTNSSDWKQFAIDLINAHQNNKLKANNVKSYFAWKTSTSVDGSTVVEKMPALAAKVPRISGNQQLMSFLSDGEWTNYRLNFATVVGQLEKMRVELPSKYRSIFSEDTWNRIRDSHERSYDEILFRQIPIKCFGILKAWMLVTESSVTGIYSADRAYDDLTVIERESLKNFFTKALEDIKVYKGGITGGFQTMPSSVYNV